MKEYFTLRNFLKALGWVAIILTLAPLIAMNYWWIRIFDFPHIQLTILTLIALILYFLRFDIKNKADYFFVATVLACFIFQLLKIWPYTPLAPFELLPSKQKETSENQLKIFSSNVLQKNDKYQLLINESEKFDADLVLLTETDAIWIEKVKSKLGNKYPYKVEVPLNNTYGMFMLSKFTLTDTYVDYLIDDQIPSIHTILELPTGKKIRLHAIHPTPPMPQENPMSTDRDAELMKIALMSKNETLPVIVLGDFNDVAWSQSTNLFEDISGLLDMRKGRGFYNTYSANNRLLRWPLDHLFVSEHFTFGKMNRGEDVGSDHFPFYALIYLEPELKNKQKRESPKKSKIENAKKEIKEAQEQ